MNDFNQYSLITQFAVTREIIDSLTKYQALVLKWNQKINLIASNSLENFVERHIIDSLQLLKFIDNKDLKLIDIGSGAGLPGIVLSIAGVKTVTLIEANSKKAAFLLQAAECSTNNIVVINERIEQVTQNCAILTSRACAKVSTIFALCSNITVSDKYLLLKGANYQAELEAAQHVWSFDCKITQSSTSLQGVIIEITNLAKKHGN